MSVAPSNRNFVLPGQDKPYWTIGPAPYRRRPWALLSLLALSLAACHKPAGPAAEGAAPDLSGYLAPPMLTAAVHDADGGATFSGHAPPDAEVRLREPGGAAFSATANDDGDWSMQLPPPDTPRMFAFEGELSGRLLHGEGAIIALPPPAPAAVLARGGYGALPIGVAPVSAGPPRIMAVDYDGAGGGSVSGVTAARAPVRVLLDGQAVGAGQSDGQGRFAVLDLSVSALDPRARKLFTPGPHTIRIEGPSGAVQGQLTVAHARPLDGEAFRTVREGGAWRTDWRTPGGGVQTTLVFGASPASNPEDRP